MKLGEHSKKFQQHSFPYFLENGLSQLTFANYGSYYFYNYFLFLFIDFLPFSVLFSLSCG